VSESPAAPVAAPQQDQGPEYTEPNELSAPAETPSVGVEATSDTGAESDQAPRGPASTPASATSGPSEEDDR
jgi:hypothetical protein